MQNLHKINADLCLFYRAWTEGAWELGLYLIRRQQVIITSCKYLFGRLVIS